MGSFKRNCTKLAVDLSGMKFRCCLNILKKQTCRPKAKLQRCTNGPSKFLSEHKMFCNGFIKTHGTFRCDL